MRKTLKEAISNLLLAMEVDFGLPPNDVNNNDKDIAHWLQQNINCYDYDLDAYEAVQYVKDQLSKLSEPLAEGKYQRDIYQQYQEGKIDEEAFNKLFYMRQRWIRKLEQE